MPISHPIGAPVILKKLMVKRHITFKIFRKNVVKKNEKVINQFCKFKIPNQTVKRILNECIYIYGSGSKLADVLLPKCDKVLDLKKFEELMENEAFSEVDDPRMSRNGDDSGDSEEDNSHSDKDGDESGGLDEENCGNEDVVEEKNKPEFEGTKNIGGKKRKWSDNIVLKLLSGGESLDRRQKQRKTMKKKNKRKRVFKDPFNFSELPLPRGEDELTEKDRKRFKKGKKKKKKVTELNEKIKKNEDEEDFDDEEIDETLLKIPENRNQNILYDEESEVDNDDDDFGNCFDSVKVVKHVNVRKLRIPNNYIPQPPLRSDEINDCLLLCDCDSDEELLPPVYEPSSFDSFDM